MKSMRNTLTYMTCCRICDQAAVLYAGEHAGKDITQKSMCCNRRWKSPEIAIRTALKTGRKKQIDSLAETKRKGTAQGIRKLQDHEAISVRWEKETQECGAGRVSLLPAQSKAIQNCFICCGVSCAHLQSAIVRMDHGCNRMLMAFSTVSVNCTKMQRNFASKGNSLGAPPLPQPTKNTNVHSYMPHFLFAERYARDVQSRTGPAQNAPNTIATDFIPKPESNVLLPVQTSEVLRDLQKREDALNRCATERVKGFKIRFLSGNFRKRVAGALAC